MKGTEIYDDDDDEDDDDNDDDDDDDYDEDDDELDNLYSAIGKKDKKNTHWVCFTITEMKAETSTFSTVV